MGLVEAQRVALEDSDKKHSEQAAVNPRISKEQAEFHGACSHLVLRVDSQHNDTLASIKGQDMCDLVGGIIGDLIETKTKTTAKDMQQMNDIIISHETREANMATYFDKLMGERLAEGAMLMKSFELVDTQLLNLTMEMAR